MIYRKEIDGLRAVAVLPVVFFHSGIDFFSGGYVGVDVFFVISGFLITTILISDLDSGKYSLINFYERRARRILPVLFFVALCTLPFAWFWLDPFALKEFSQSLVSVFSFSSNVYFYLKTGYFDIASESKPLLHTWSLAVEEQFYIIFPVLLLLIWKRLKKYISVLFVTLFIASLVYSQSLVARDFSAAFYMLHSRAWELIAGSLIALYLFIRSPFEYSTWTQVGSLAGLLLLLYSFFFFDELTPFPGLYALVPVLGSAMIILFAVKGTIAHRLLSIPIIVFVGLISYSVYLWHQPVLAFFRVITGSEPSALESIAIILLVLILSVASFRLIETPFRKQRDGLFSRNSIFGITFVGIVLFIGIGLSGHISNGYPERNAQFLRLQQNFGLSDVCSGASLDNAACRTTDNPKVILWGDSHAMHLAQALDKLFMEKGILQSTLSACPPVPNYRDADLKAAISCFKFNKLVMSYFRQIASPSEYTVIVSTSKNLTLSTLRQDFMNAVVELKALGYQIIYISSTPQFPEVGSCVVSSIRKNEGFDSCQYNEDEIKNLSYFSDTKEMADELGISYISLLPFFCEHGRCVVEKNGILFLRDASHFAVESMTLLHSFVKDRITESNPLIIE